MNDTGNMGVNNTSVNNENNTGVAGASPDVSIANNSTNNVEIKVSSVSADSIINEPKKTSKEENNKILIDGGEFGKDLTNQNTNRAPIIVLATFICILVIVFIYYFVIMTPYKVYSKAFDAIFNNIQTSIDNYKENKNYKYKIDINVDLETNQTINAKYTNQLKSVDYINGDHFEGSILVDSGKENIKAKISVDKKIDNFNKLGISDLIEDNTKEKQRMMDISMYKIGNQTYVGPIDYINYNDIDNFGKEKILLDKPIKSDVFKMMFGEDSVINSNMFDIDRIQSIFNIAELLKTKILAVLDEKELSRTINVKKIGGTTAVVLKSSANVGKEKISSIHKDLFSSAINDKTEDLNGKHINIINEIMLITGLEREEVINRLKELYEKDSLVDKVEVDLYMNLANTELIAFNIRIDEKYSINVSHLNEYYQVNASMVNGNKKEFNLNASYNQVKGTVDGLVVLDNDNTNTGILIDYDGAVTKDSIKNTLVLELYNNETYKEDNKEPLVKLNCSMNIIDSEVDFESEVNESTEIDETNINSLLKFKNNILSHIDYVIDHALYNKGNSASKRKMINDLETENETLE